MAELYANTYRIETARLQSWDYANEAMYFVTICTKNRENYFGKIIELSNVRRDAMHGVSMHGLSCHELQPTEIGKIATDEWFKTPALRPDMNLELGEFVVMPNHIHGIIIIGANEYNTHGNSDRNTQPRRDAMHRVSTYTDTDTETATEYKNQFAPQSKNLASIIRGYKSAVATYARKNNIEFNWQPRFHDHIIRSADDYHKISNYIINNPDKWYEDKFFVG